jgi:hypothetical protein
VLKLQQDVEGIIKQLIAAGMSEQSFWENPGHPGPIKLCPFKEAEKNSILLVSASKKASKALDPKQNVTVTNAASETEVILSDDDLEDNDLASKANSTQEAPSPAIRKTTQ